MNRLGGEEGAEAFKRGDVILAPNSQKLLRLVVRATPLPVIKELVVKDMFTSKNSSREFRNAFFNVVERNIPASQVHIMTLLEEADGLSIATMLGVRRSVVWLSHFVDILQNDLLFFLTKRVMAFIMDASGVDVQIVEACRLHGEWYYDVVSLGNMNVRQKGSYFVVSSPESPSA
ncbi:MAG: hypothetical protein AAB463_00970 [Patescibacteria group bacterium]